MKNFFKIIILMFVIVFLFAVVSCGDKPEESSSEDIPSTVDTSADAETSSNDDDTTSDTETSDDTTSSYSEAPANQEDKNSDLGSGWSPNFTD